MNRLFITALAVISIMFAFVGCNQSEPENNQDSDNQQTTPPSAQTGKKISASSLADLQSKIEGSTDSVLDLSQCSNLGSGTLTINKAITLQNFTDTGASIVVTDANVTLSSFNVNSITTQNSGSSSLKIANSSLASLTLSGDGVARSDGRAETKPKITLVSSAVTSKVQLNEAVEIDIANFGANVPSFEGNAAATINLTAEAYSDISGQYDGSEAFSFNGTLSDDVVYAELAEFGPAGQWLEMKSKTFPAKGLAYVSNLLSSNNTSFPNPSFSSAVSQSYFLYQFLTDDSLRDMINTYKAFLGDEAEAIGSMLQNMNFRCFMVEIPADKGFNLSAYKQQLEAKGFESEDGDEYLFNVMDDTMSEKMLSVEITEHEDNSVSLQFNAIIMDLSAFMP